MNGKLLAQGTVHEVFISASVGESRLLFSFSGYYFCQKLYHGKGRFSVGLDMCLLGQIIRLDMEVD